MEFFDGSLFFGHQTIQFAQPVFWTSRTVVMATIWIIPYWSLVIPLTLLSAWLILGKPRR